MSMCFLYIVYGSQKSSFYLLETLVQLTGYVKEMVELLERQANLKMPSYTPFSLLSIRFHPSILVSYLKQGQLNFALRLLATINPCIAFPGRGGPPSKFPENWVLHKVHFFLQELVQIPFEVSEVPEIWLAINEGGYLIRRPTHLYIL